MNILEKRFLAKLEERRQINLYRSRYVVDARSGAKLSSGAKEYLSFTHNDYLGLSNHPKIIKAWKSSVEHYGASSSASHLLGGYCKPHHELEKALAEFLGYESVLLFSTGYMANLGVFTALMTEDDHIFQDKFNHASLIDAGRYCLAKFSRYQHLNLADLTRKLSQASTAHKWIVSDGVFSMDGHIAPLPELAALAKQHQAALVIDDAHGLGVLGANGRGSLEFHSMNSQDVPILVGTFGKALGCFGAFVASSKIITESLLQFSRSYIYTTALPPGIASSIAVSLQVVQDETWRREYLNNLIKRFYQKAQEFNLPVTQSMTPIQTILIGCSAKTMEIAARLAEAGIIVGAVRPPTVPPNTARLRICLSVHHQESDIDYLIETLAGIICSNV